MNAFTKIMCGFFCISTLSTPFRGIKNALFSTFRLVSDIKLDLFGICRIKSNVFSTFISIQGKQIISKYNVLHYLLFKLF